MLKRDANRKKDREPPPKKSRGSVRDASNRNKQNVTVWASLLLEPSDSTPYATFEMKFEAGHGLTVMRIAESVKLELGNVLQNVAASDLHVFSGRNHVRLLKKDDIWNIDSHGGGSEDKALLVKVAVPFVMPNQGLSVEIHEKLNFMQKNIESLQKEIQIEREERRKKNQSFRISSVPVRFYKDILANLNLRLDTAKWNGLPNNDTQDDDDHFFTWSPEAEHSLGNRTAYMNHLRSFSWPDGYSIVDVSSNESLLSVNLAEFSFNGTIDVVLAKSEVIREDIVDQHIMLGIELKKSSAPAEKENKYRSQVVVEHLSASYQNRDTGVLTLLTDLNELWCFFWFGGRRRMFKRSTNMKEAKYLLTNMFNSEVATDCPEGFASRLSWNECFSDDERILSEMNPGGTNADRGDENDHSHADTRSNSTNDDDNAHRDDMRGTSGGIDTGSTKAINVGGKRVVERKEWNDGRDVGNEMDLLDFVDDDLRKGIFLNTIFQSSFSKLLPSRVFEDGDNDGNLRLTETNLMQHDVYGMIDG